MKIIFSRKGFDGTAGGCPSPIIDGHPRSLPIPTRMPTPIGYGDLKGAPYADLVSDLTGGRLSGKSPCHLDPDIDPSELPRTPGWRGALGQVSAAQAHLSNQGVGSGDVFVFWGLFRPAELDNGRWRFVGSREHRIWGWLQIGEVVPLGSDGSEALIRRPWLQDHPHVRAGWSPRNTIYVASERLALDGTLLAKSGSGVLSRGLRLSADNGTPSVWRVPDWLHPLGGGSGMTYHPPNRWRDKGLVQVAARGQEFVADVRDKSAAISWLRSVVEETDGENLALRSGI